MMEPAVQNFHATTASAPPRMDGQLTLLKKKMRSRPSSRADTMSCMQTLPMENNCTSAASRGVSAPPCQLPEPLEEPRSLMSTPSPQPTSDRFAPKRIERSDGLSSACNRRSASGSAQRRKSLGLQYGQQPSSARQPHAIRHVSAPVTNNSTHSMPPPLPSSSSSQGNPNPTTAQVNRYAEICGLSIPVFFLSRILCYVPVAGIPAFRRICTWFHRAVTKRLTVDSALRSALVSHLERQRQKSKRVWVVVRARPWDDMSCITIDQNSRVQVRGSTDTEPYFFDRAFTGSATQEEVSDYVTGQILRYALNREHLCILAYGQTGSGKTHTMFGSLERGGASQQGVAFRALNTLAVMFREKHVGPPPGVELSFLEVYNDQLFDLLDKQRQLPRQRSSEKHNVPQGLTRKRCEIGRMEEQVHALLCEGAATRTVGKTVFNPRSSRSHAVVMLHICWDHDSSGRCRSAPQETRIYLVDLAGCERAGMYAISPEQRKEGENINLSLSALGRVVNALSSGKCEHVPYRDSALTWLLKDAITGTSARVCMVAALHPAHPVETASTLRYARQYSSLQSSTGTRMPQLAREARDLQRRVDSMKHNFEKALSSEDNLLHWNRESLKGTVHCQLAMNAKELVEEHPYLSWTDSHQSKLIARGQRKDKSGIGYISHRVDIPLPRDPRDKPDGRAVSIDAKNGIACDRSVEVTFEGKNGRPPVILWLPELAVEMVQPPRPLVEALEKLQAAEGELGRKQAELQSARKEEAAEQQGWMETSNRTG